MCIYRHIVLVLLIALSSLLLPFHSKAQFAFLDTATASFHHKPKFFIDIGSYNSIVSGQPAIFTDLLFGISYHRRVYFSAGISVLNTEVITPQIINNEPVTAKLNMGLFVLSAEYVFSRDYPWIFSVIPFKLGIGNAYYQYISEPDKKLMTINEHTILTYQPQLTASYNIFTWIGFGGSLGYRFTLFSPAPIRRDLDSFTYSFGVKLFLDPIYDAVFPHGIFGKKKETKVNME